MKNILNTYSKILQILLKGITTSFAFLRYMFKLYSFVFCKVKKYYLLMAKRGFEQRNFQLTIS